MFRVNIKYQRLLTITINGFQNLVYLFFGQCDADCTQGGVQLICIYGTPSITVKQVEDFSKGWIYNIVKLQRGNIVSYNSPIVNICMWSYEFTDWTKNNWK